MKASELRIGNWVQGQSLSIPRLHIQHDGKLMLTGYGIDAIERGLLSVSPIPLTPEILEQCGCIRGNDKTMWRNPYGVWLTQIADSQRFYVSGFRAGHSIGYLHEFQNVTFSLTGQELVYSPIKELT